MKRDFIMMARVGRRRRVVVPPWVACELSVIVGVQDIVTILPRAERCTVLFWREQLVEAYPECRGQEMESGRGK
jgi:hypothetical protein